MMRLPDTNMSGSAVIEVMKLQAPTFFTSYFLVCAEGLSEEDRPPCFSRLQ